MHIQRNTDFFQRSQEVSAEIQPHRAKIESNVIVKVTGHFECIAKSNLCPTSSGNRDESKTSEISVSQRAADMAGRIARIADKISNVSRVIGDMFAESYSHPVGGRLLKKVVQVNQQVDDSRLEQRIPSISGSKYPAIEYLSACRPASPDRRLALPVRGPLIGRHIHIEISLFGGILA
jgi:uncharacterized protein (UPF0335 family)